VGLAAVVKQIEETTEALAKALGRGPGQKRSSPRSIRLREALTECSAAFNWIHQDLAWTAEHTPPGASRTQLDNLLAPFTALLSRFPPTSGAKGGPQVKKKWTRRPKEGMGRRPVRGTSSRRPKSPDGVKGSPQVVGRPLRRLSIDRAADEPRRGLLSVILRALAHDVGLLVIKDHAGPNLAPFDRFVPEVLDG
jgi:hypothetical protein